MATTVNNRDHNATLISFLNNGSACEFSLWYLKFKHNQTSLIIAGIIELIIVKLS